MTSAETAAEEPVVRGRAIRESVRRLAFVSLLIAVTTFVVRTVPWFDPPVSELATRLHAIPVEMDAQREKGDVAAWKEFAERSELELKRIADETKRCLSRREGVWGFVAGTDRREEAALKEVARLASSEIPALLASGLAGHALRGRTVTEALSRLDDHLAGASPYIPPLKPIENQEGLEKSVEVGCGMGALGRAFLIFDGLLLFGLVVWLWPRRAARP